jgi:hypothetical protein
MTDEDDFMFVQYSCGCMGIPLSGKDALLLDRCDDPDGDSTTLEIRDMDGKESEPLNDSHSKNLIQAAYYLIGDGYRFREIKKLLG